ncbi:MAG: hypothetical protein AB7S75_16615 [Desulfococcaceae bacterium]
MKNYTATEALELLLTDFRERRKNFSFLCNYDDSMMKMRKNYQQKINQISEPLKFIAEELFEIADQSFFLFQLIEWKIDFLAEGLLHAIQSKNPLSLANNARALVEHIASISGIGYEINQLENSLLGQQSEKKIKAAIDKVKTYLKRSYYGKSPKISNETDYKSIHINDLLEILAKEIQNIEEIYDFLCEYVHPNYGSNLLVSTGKLANGNLNPPEEYNLEILDKLRRICSYCMIYLSKEIAGYFSSPIRIQALVDRCLIRGVKLQNVFAIKEVKPMGDGQSKETAYFFTKARTPQEAIELTYKFFESENYELLGRKEIGGIEDGYIYDIHHTNKGKIWVKIPQLKL